MIEISHQVLQHEPVYKDLSAICARERIPRETPIELLRFLALMLHRYKGSVPKACGLSPSAAMDHLWHIVLLNTRLNEGVAALIGGRVEHSTDGMDDAEEVKAERREAAMKAMEQSGWEGSPSAAVWTPPAAQGKTENDDDDDGNWLNTNGVPVVVHTICGDTIFTPPVLTVLDVKRIVHARKKHMPICQQRLLYRGKKLDDSSSLADYGIRPMSAFYLYLSLKGC